MHKHGGAHTAIEGYSGECPSEVTGGHLVYEEGGLLGVLECLV